MASNSGRTTGSRFTVLQVVAVGARGEKFNPGVVLQEGFLKEADGFSRSGFSFSNPVPQVTPVEKVLLSPSQMKLRKARSLP